MIDWKIGWWFWGGWASRDHVSRVVRAKETAYYSRASTSRAKTNVSCSSSSITQPTPTQVNMDNSESEEEDIDGYKFNNWVNEDDDQFSDDEFDL